MWLLLALGTNLCWSISDVLNSINVRHCKESPVVYAWLHSIVVIALFTIIFIFFDLRSSWILVYALAGFTSYLASLYFYYVISRIDISIMSASWAFLAIGMSVVGFVFLGETWNVYQSIGVGLILVGIFVLAFYHVQLPLFHTLLLLMSLGTLWIPVFIIQKIALLHSESFITVLVWPVFFQQIFAFVIPLSSFKFRRLLASRGLRTNRLLISLCFLSACCIILGWIFSTAAYQIAPASLVSVTLNSQVFIVIFLAWISTRILPAIAPKELLSSQSVTLKLGCFSIVFIGLALLAIP